MPKLSKYTECNALGDRQEVTGVEYHPNEENLPAVVALLLPNADFDIDAFNIAIKDFEALSLTMPDQEKSQIRHIRVIDTHERFDAPGESNNFFVSFTLPSLAMRNGKDEAVKFFLEHKKELGFDEGSFFIAWDLCPPEIKNDIFDSYPEIEQAYNGEMGLTPKGMKP